MSLHNPQPRYLYKIATNGCLINLNGNGIIGNLDFNIGHEVFVGENLYLDRSIIHLGCNYDRLYSDGADFQLSNGSNLGPRFQNQSQPALNHGSTLYFPEVGNFPRPFYSPPVVVAQGQVISPQNPNQATVIQVPVERVVHLENPQLQRDLVNLREQNTTLTRQLASNSTEILKLQSQITLTHQQGFKEGKDQAYRQYQDRLRGLTENASREKARNAEGIHRYQQQLESQIADLNASLIVERETNSSQATLLSKKDNEIAHLQGQEDKLKLELQQSNRREAAAALAATKAQEAIEEAKNQYRQLEAEHKREKDKITAGIGSLGLIAAAAKKELHELTTAHEKLNSDFAQAKREAEGLRRQLNTQAAEAETAQAARRQAAQAGQAAQAARGEAAELRARLVEVEELRRQLATARRDAAQAAQARVGELESAHAAQAAELRSALAAARRDAQAAQAARGEAAELRARLVEVEELRGQLDAARREAAQAARSEADQALANARHDTAVAQAEASKAVEAARRQAAQAGQAARREATKAQEARGESERLRSQLATKDEAAQAARSEADQALATAQREAKTAQREAEGLRRQLNTQAAEAETAQAARGDVERLRRELAAKDEAAQAERFRAQAAENAAQLTAARREAAEALAAAKDEDARAQAAEATRLRAQLEAGQGQLAAAQSQLATSQRELAATQEVQSQLAAAQAEVVSLRDELQEARAQAAQARDTKGGVARREAAIQTEGSGGQPSTSPSGTSAKALAKYKFELKDTKSANQKLLRLTYLGDGSYYEHSVDFEISASHPLVEKVKHNRARSEIIGTFLFGKIDEFNNKNLRIDDTSIKRFFSGQGVPIETCGALPMDLLKAIIRTKRSQSQDQGQAR
jgi:hypothetical protein